MKSLVSIVTIGSLIAPTAALARPYVGNYEAVCYREEYVETYHPGTRNRPGYITYDTEQVRVPCQRNRLSTDGIRPYDPYEPEYVPTGNVDDNSCVEGAIIGGILGGAAVAAGSRGPDMAWAIPLGVVGGGVVGCQIDGG